MSLSKFVLVLLSLSISLPVASMMMPVHDTPVNAGLARVMTSMHTAMVSFQPTGNPDADFAAMMILHHQGAIEMAKVELLYGTDPRLRRLAQGIIVTQQSEITAMQLTLDRPKQHLN